ncbi:MAG: DUF4124 domain-containing protein [Proteobacteria bacterium]|nr:DUF4124 domain-containing protein [Pseudomonadota bacterium]
MHHCIKIGLLIVILGCNVAVAENYYRYKDKDGRLVITGTLPSEVADEGYEIISPRGNVIETVKPVKSKEEIAKEDKEQAAQKQAELKNQEIEKQAQLQAKKDEILLKSFSTEEDIIRSRDEQIASIVILEQIMQQNITRLKKQLNDAKVLKVNYEKKGEAVPAALQKTIDDSERQIKDNLDFLERKKSEKQSINDKYQTLIERYHQLQQNKSLPNKQP